MSLPFRAVLLAAAALACAAGRAATFYVAADGVDDPARGGRSPASAWASLAYATDRAPVGVSGEATVILIGAGLFVAEGPATVKPFTTIAGAGVTRTTIRASDT